MSEDKKKDGVDPGESRENPRLSNRPGKRMRTPADMLWLDPEVSRKLVANRARLLWRQKGMLPELEAECWLEAEAELTRKV